MHATTSVRAGRSLLLDANATSRIEPYPLNYANDSIKHNQIDNRDIPSPYRCLS